MKSCNFVIIVWPWPVNWYQHEVLASCHSNMVHVYVVRLHVFLCFQVNQVLNLCNTINYVNFIVYFLLAVMWHDSYLPPFHFQPKIWSSKKLYKIDQIPLGFYFTFCRSFLLQLLGSLHSKHFYQLINIWQIKFIPYSGIFRTKSE